MLLVFFAPFAPLREIICCIAPDTIPYFNPTKIRAGSFSSIKANYTCMVLAPIALRFANNYFTQSPQRFRKDRKEI